MIDTTPAEDGQCQWQVLRTQHTTQTTGQQTAEDRSDRNTHVVRTDTLSNSNLLLFFFGFSCCVWADILWSGSIRVTHGMAMAHRTAKSPIKSPMALTIPFRDLTHSADLYCEYSSLLGEKRRRFYSDIQLPF
ncbi:hypothetical protein FS842_004538 [Serendipita sp. 407]|nr:hypothetical protein FS842_004538 [Serendipita sp. 407]